MEQKKSKKVRPQPFLFNEEQMALFGVKNTNARRGRGQDPSKVDAYSARGNEMKQCIYAVETRVVGNGNGICRTWDLPIMGVNSKRGSIKVEMNADSNRRVGFGFATLTLKIDGQTTALMVDAKTFRNIAQLANAVANSSRSVWRKSSILS